MCVPIYGRARTFNTNNKLKEPMSRNLDGIDTIDKVCCYHERTRAPECQARQGRIPAGERHYVWLGVGSDEDPARVCHNCVRMSQWESYKDKPITTKVRIEYSDGSVMELSGEGALDWAEACASTAVMSWAHGSTFPKLPWKKIEPK